LTARVSQRSGRTKEEVEREVDDWRRENDY